MIFVIDSEEVFGKCVVRALKKNGFEAQLFNNAIEAMEEISRTGAPDLVFIDVMLAGPDGFTFLNEMASYADTFETPIVIVSERGFLKFDLKAYGVVGILDKKTMKPEEVVEYANKYT
ncbi:response regulator [Candidatus Saccharibacteria bacterium]|nr:response regulator [Candidatus Saccharibacteria bacterium]